MRIGADRDVCIGAAVCSSLAPDVFDQDTDEGLVVVTSEYPDPTRTAAAREAVESCPSGALFLLDDSFPTTTASPQ